MAEKKCCSKKADKKSGSGKFILGAALGAIGGAIAGVLMAPKSGKETRKDIKDGANKVAKKAKTEVAKEAKTVKAAAAKKAAPAKKTTKK